MIPVNYQFEIPLVSSGGFTGDFSASWYLDVGSILYRLESIGYAVSVTRNFSAPTVFIRFIGVPDYFAQSLGSNQAYYYQQAQLDAETSVKLAQTGQLTSTQWATPFTYADNNVIQPITNSINSYLPSAGALGDAAGTATPILLIGGLLVLILYLKK
jgi:hypothetical protein